MFRNRHVRFQRWKRTDHLPAVSGLLAVVRRENSPAAIGSAVDADPVRQMLGMALRALHQSRPADRIVGAAAIAAALRNLTFWQRSHVELSPMFLISSDFSSDSHFVLK